LMCVRSDSSEVGPIQMGNLPAPLWCKVGAGVTALAPPTPKQVADYVRRALDRECPPDAIAAHLFGSCLDGDMRADSDIDDVGIIAERAV
jgi:hypothetical protein